MRRSSNRSAILSVVALARAGALDHAWATFEEAGLDEVRDDPRVLTVKGRLLKDRARMLEAHGQTDDARQTFSQAADAYQMAASLDPATYPLINAATLRLLAGDESQSRELARTVLDRIADNPDEPETPFYKSATRAEARLLVGDTSAALDDLSEAVFLAPRAWEDHAVTLRQFEMILAMRGEDTGPLDPLKPPRTLHFAGHIRFGGAIDEDALCKQVRAYLERANIGFAFGALAAGADIIIAEQVVARGAELHAVLPGGRRAFGKMSVVPSDEDWEDRFERLLSKADTVREIEPVGDPPDAAMIALGNLVAMGCATMLAERYATQSCQLLLMRDGNHEAAQATSATGEAGAIWRSGGRAQEIITVDAPAAVTAPCEATRDHRMQHPVVCLAVAPADEDARLAARPDLLDALHQACGSHSYKLPPRWSDGKIVLSFGDVEEALALGMTLAGDGWRIGGDLVAAQPFADPFTGTRMLGDAPLAPLAGTVRSALSRQFIATENLAAAARALAPHAARMEPIGELEERPGATPLALYSVRAA